MASIAPELIRAAVRIVDSASGVQGTGFGYARPDGYHASNPSAHTAESDEEWKLWFVTCAHVIDAIEARHVAGQSYVCVELNEVAAGGGRVGIDYPGRSWTRHDGWVERCSRLGPISSRAYTPEDAAVDVAVAMAPMPALRLRQLDWWGFAPKFHLTKPLMTAGDSPKDRPLQEGDGIFVLGFPVGYYEDAKNWPVVRQGVLAQIQPYLEGAARTFLIDGSVFGGNSGGPVVSIPQPTAIRGTKQFSKSALLGMVSGSQLAPPSKENADLGIVVPTDTLNDTIEMALGRLPRPNGSQGVRLRDLS